jgi:hypothetical protein
VVTSVFRIRPNLDEYLSLTANEADIARLVNEGAFKGQPMAASWVPLRVWMQEVYQDDRRRILGDFVNFISGCLVMTARAADALGAMLRPAGEFLSLDSDLPLVAWNCTEVINALDPARTKGVKYPSGVGYMRVSRYVLRQDSLDDHAIFKVPERVGSDLFISDATARAIEDHGLVGLSLEPVEFA